ncbi:MAG TPA: Crp/Fnr family transcriptional regulator [Candidatus Saccharimonadales bacterium]|nr:Crp/Fnr family transcriptional regulator [Candidatus Saccharimonadales bacterium]
MRICVILIGMLANTAYTDAWVKAFGKGTRLRYNKGEFIIRPGDAPSGVFFIETGLVKAYDITKYGEENLLIIRKEHEIFPLIWAITGLERKIIYQTLSPTTVWRLSREDYLAYIESNAEASHALVAMAVEMYRIHSERIINLEYRTVRERLISFVLTMSRRFGKQTKDGVLIDVPLRQQDIASSINASRETTSRELSALEKKGLISTAAQYILLKDIEKLRTFL